jgi:hypothetical protein
MTVSSQRGMKKGWALGRLLGNWVAEKVGYALVPASPLSRMT